MRIYPKILFLISVTSAVVLLGESAAFAQRYYGRGSGPSPGYRSSPAYGAWYGGAHQHDGFYMRLTAGLGYLDASETYGGATDSYSGIGASFSAAFGGTIAPNLILYGEFLMTTITNAEWSLDGVKQGYSGMDMTLYGFGPGIAYYFMPINLYLSGTLTFTRVSFVDTYATYLGEENTDIGIGLSFTVGKEWWVSRDWGLGIAGQFHIASMRDDIAGYSPRLRAAAFSLLFSATYN
jgi:hypothetical protein